MSSRDSERTDAASALPHHVRLRLALEDCTNRIEVLLGKLKTIAREMEEDRKP